MIEHVKLIICSALCYAWALLIPVHHVIWAVLLLLFMNFVFGLTADIVENKYKKGRKKVAWNNTKAIWAFLFLLIIVVIICGFYLIGYFLNKPNEAVTGVSWFCIAAVWFFGRNINRNLLKILPKHTAMWQLFSFTYYVLSLQMVEKIPYLGDFINLEKVRRDKEYGTKDTE